MSRFRKLLLISAVCMVFGSGLSVSMSPADAEGNDQLAAGTLYDASGRPVADAVIIAFVIERNSTAEIWRPFAEVQTGRDGSYVMSAPTDHKLVKQAIQQSAWGNGEGLQIAFIARQPNGQLAMYTVLMDESATAAGTWTPETAEADLAPVDGDSLVMLTRRANGKFTGSLGADRSGGIGMNLVLSPIESIQGHDLASPEALSHETPDRQGDEAGFDQTQASLPIYSECHSRHPGNPYNWHVEWRNWTTRTKAGVRSMYYRTNSGTADFEYSNKRETKVEVGWISKGKVGGSMGFYRESTNAWGGKTNRDDYRHGYLKFELEYSRQGFYCVNDTTGRRYYESIWRDVPETWTGGSSWGGSTRGTFPSRWEVSTVIDMWVSQNETNQISYGVTVAGYSFKSQQKMNESYKLTYNRRNKTGSQKLRGNNAYPTSANFVQQTEG